MIKLRADWVPDVKYPDRRWQAPVVIDLKPCDLILEDATSYTSGIRYISLEVDAPYQGHGVSLSLEVNGVAVTLVWNGGNQPSFPATPTSADYRIEGSHARTGRAASGA